MIISVNTYHAIFTALFMTFLSLECSLLKSFLNDFIRCFPSIVYEGNEYAIFSIELLFVLLALIIFNLARLSNKLYKPNILFPKSFVIP